MLPTIEVTHRLAQAQFGPGMAACAAIVTPATIVTPSTADHARLALWIDEISDSVRGRWRLNHSVSIGGDFGYFTGALVAGSLASDGSCSAPNVRLRFYEGAELGEVLPPNGRLEHDGRGEPSRS